jgi:hypothetical protein
MTIRRYLHERRQGKTLSAENATALATAHQAIGQVFDDAGLDPEDFYPSGPDGTLDGTSDPYGDGSTQDGTGQRVVGRPAGAFVRTTTGNIEVR